MAPPSVLMRKSARSVLTVSSSPPVTAAAAGGVGSPLLGAAGAEPADALGADDGTVPAGTSPFLSAGVEIGATGLGGAGGAFSFCHA